MPRGCIDHINGDRADNRIINLREATKDINSKNKRKYKNNKTGIQGVSWCEKIKKFRAYISINKKPVSIGVYKTLLDAASARIKSQQEIGYHKNHGK